MSLRRSSLVVAALLAGSTVFAQPAPDPAGHWQGAIQVPEHEVPIAVDLAKNAAGDLVGAFTSPQFHIDGLPLADVAAEGASVRFAIKANGGGPFKGTLSADGASLAGEFTTKTPQGEMTFPFTLTRAGAARMPTPPRSAPLGREMVGRWDGTMDANGGLRVMLRLENHPDGTSTGTFVSVDQGGLELPVAITQKASTLTLDVTSVGSTYAATLNDAGTELVGTFTTPEGMALPLTLRRSK